MEKNLLKLPSDYISGLTDGEGCFALKFRRDIRHERKGSPVYYYWSVEFAILLDQKDLPLLELVQKTLECGKISISKRGAARYSVSRFLDLEQRIVPFFEKHRLYGKKWEDFKLWGDAVSIIVSASQNKKFKVQKVEFSRDNLDRLEKIYHEMRQFKGKTRKWKWIGIKQGRSK